MNTQRHNVFVSYHHDDDEYRNWFEYFFADGDSGIMISKSVQMGDIDDGLPAETIRQKIRDEYLRDSTVTVVLIGIHTWQRKHVDWEIASSIRDTVKNPRSGLLGIFLPSYPLINNNFNPYTIPPRLYYNWKRGFAELHAWSENPYEVQEWIHNAFLNKDKISPDHSYPLFSYNKSGEQWHE